LVLSLIADADVTQELTPDGEIVKERFVKSVISSNEAFTYEAAQVRKDNKCVIISRLVTERG
jgi:exoribonuclease R